MTSLESSGAGRLVLLIAALAAGLVAVAHASASDGQVPFTATVSGTAAFTSPSTVEFHGAGNAPLLGLFASAGQALLETPTTCPTGTPGIPNVHTETLTGANGDKLVLRMENLACSTGPFTFHGTGHWTVVGGSGRFEDVSGRGTNEGNADFESSTFVLTMTGSLTLR
jgi:hypothetical protein